MSVVLAKGGLRLDDKFDTLDRRNAEIVRMFFARTPDDHLEFETLTGIRDIIEFDTDLVRKEVSRRVNMEYDWKRKPDILFDHEDYRHCAFSTVPWDTVEQFRIVRDLFDKYLDSDPHCIKSVGDFDSSSVYIDANMQLPEDQRRYPSERVHAIRGELLEHIALETVERRLNASYGIDADLRILAVISDILPSSVRVAITR